MAKKEGYGIRASLVANPLDAEVTLQKDGVGFRPLPIKFVLITIASLCGCLHLLLSDMVSVGTGFQKALFVVLWILMTVLLFFNSKTQLLNIQVLVSFLSYLLVPGNRKLKTRKLDPDAVYNMLDVTNIKHIDANGMITFQDNDVGYMYRITGNASGLLFDSDRDRILRRVDAFYRGVDPDVEFIFMTLKEPQRVYHQAAAVKRRYQNLTVQDPDLTNLANNQLVVCNRQIAKKTASPT